MGVIGSELEALRLVEENGGSTGAQPVARKMKINVDYARTILTSLAKRDYLDLSARGIYTMTWKGKEVVERKRK
ncbi:MAG: hypothetical protein SCARUB_00545 [Candidatus Scalindua rubra]|uniref:ArnR1-like winged helix-turn-helix domain-containing protein n=1 Tax=Candidatus Scalindua rubra TaxID=1872076 RepID=A0A1E3XF64_9BACT|nr:MAG: hypothetical protein SCARUB_00545 [Candidatus Scalindua rubra]